MVGRDEALIQKTEYEIMASNIKSSFYQQNYIPDNVKKVFNEDVSIDLEDIDNLNNYVTDKFKIHEHLGFTISVDIKFQNRKTEHFGSWNEYKAYNWVETSAISSIILTWKFNAKFPGQEIPQLHTLIVKLSNGIRPEEMLNIIFSGDLSDVSELENNFFPVLAQCTFTDRVFGNEIIGIVESWVDGVKNESFKSKKFIRFLKRNRNKIVKTLEMVTFIITMLTTIGLLKKSLDIFVPENILEISKDSFINVLLSVCIFMLIWKLIPPFIKSISKNTSSLIENYGFSYIFRITKTDKKRVEKMQREDNYDIIKLIFMLLMYVTTNMIPTLIENIFF